MLQQKNLKNLLYLKSKYLKQNNMILKHYNSKKIKIFNYVNNQNQNYKQKEKIKKN